MIDLDTGLRSRITVPNLSDSTALMHRITVYGVNNPSISRANRIFTDALAAVPGYTTSLGQIPSEVATPLLRVQSRNKPHPLCAVWIPYEHKSLYNVAPSRSVSLSSIAPIQFRR